MITAIGLERFKPFVKLPEIRIPLLTVLCGKNSAGKSSILHSLLLLKQSLGVELPQEALSLDGKYLQYTHLREISYGLPREATASITYRFALKDDRGFRGSLCFEIRHKKIPSAGERKGTVVNRLDWSLVKEDTEHTIHLRNGVYTWPRSAKLQMPKLFLDYSPVGATRVRFEQFLPAYVIQRARTAHEQAEREVREYRIPLGFTESPLVTLCDLLRRELDSLQYLGPSRAVPRRAYVHYSERHYDLDEDGGNAAHVFWLRRNDTVRFRDREMPLQDAVQDCLTLMGLPQQVTPKRPGDSASWSS